MINKIAAGEVIERPASVVKELVENSIDAGSSRIDIELENGGCNLIRIVDNGHGIASEQLELALSPHATSKLIHENDLFHILSFGFRGEALASIAEISQLSLKSRIVEHHEGAMLQSNGGERSDCTSCGMPVGTQIEVRNLFFNTPVRRRYMKSITTEFGHVAETFTRLALPQPNIHFTLKHNGRIVHELPPTEEPIARIRQLFGEDMIRTMIAVETPTGAAVRVSGHVSHPSQHRANNRMQYFFLNRRYIRDRALQHALNEAYRGLLVSGRFPLAFLQIELPPDMFDVNVHPTKMEVRFVDSNRIYSGFLGAIREKFLRSDLRSRVHPSAERNQESGVKSQEPEVKSQESAPPWEVAEEPQQTLDPAAAQKKRQMVEDWLSQIKTGAPAVPPRRDEYSQLSIHQLPKREKGGSKTEPQSLDCIHRAPGVNQAANQGVSQDDDTSLAHATGSADDASLVHATVNDESPSHAIGPVNDTHVVQMLDRYLVMETADGIALIDQHAMHERILYEQLKERMQSGQLDAQRLLVPVPVDLSPHEFSCVQENAEFFKTLGLQVESFGGNTVLVSAFPAILSKTLPEEILLAMLEPFLLWGKKLTQEELLDKLLHSMSCKAAVKAGERLSTESMQHLIHLAELEINVHHCPHGRPSTVLLTREEIDKMFERN